MNYLNLLPPEILAKEIFTKLRQEDLCRFGQTCRAFHAMYQQLMGKKTKWVSLDNGSHTADGIEWMSLYGIRAYTKEEAIKKYILRCTGGEYMNVIWECGERYDFELCVNLAKEFEQLELGELDPDDDEYIEFRNKHFNDIAEVLSRAGPRVFRLEEIEFE